MRSPIRIAVTGAAGNIGYALVFRIAAGDAFGPDQPVILHLLEIPGLENKLRGLKMEIEDCAFHLVQDVITGVDARRVFEGVDYIAAVGAMPRGPGMERRDLLEKNAQIFVDKGRAIQAAGNLKVKVLVVGNPCNTNALVTMHNAPGIPKENFFSMTMLDQSRARAQIALKLNVNVNTVEINVWGNHSPTMVPDIDNAKVNGRPLEEVLPNRVWLENDFIKTIQNRGYEVINARGISSAASAANAVVDALKEIHHGGVTFSMGVNSTGNPYGISDGLIYSFPCRWNSGKLSIIPGLTHSEVVYRLIKASEKELIEERDAIRSYLKG
jgi:malate dehydrogenase